MIHTSFFSYILIIPKNKHDMYLCLSLDIAVLPSGFFVVGHRNESIPFMLLDHLLVLSCTATHCPLLTHPPTPTTTTTPSLTLPPMLSLTLSLCCSFLSLHLSFTHFFACLFAVFEFQSHQVGFDSLLALSIFYFPFFLFIYFLELDEITSKAIS